MKLKLRLAVAAVAFATLASAADQASAQAPGTNRTNYALAAFNSLNSYSISVNFVGSAKSTIAGSFSTSVYAVGSGDNAGALESTYRTFCVDLFNFTGSVEEVNLGYTNGVVSKSIVGDSLDRNIGAAAYIMKQASLGLLGAYASLLPGNANILDAALQVAIWEATFDGVDGTTRSPVTAQKVAGAGGAGLNAGTNQGVFYVTSLNTSVLNLAKSILNLSVTSTGAYKTATGLLFNFAPPDIKPPANDGGFRQDQIAYVAGRDISAVPEPATLLSGVLCLGLLAGLRLRRAKRA